MVKPLGSSGRPAVQLASPSNIFVKLQRLNERELQYSLSPEDVRKIRAERSIAVDCARTMLRNGTPEIQLGQLDPLDNGRLIRLIVIRYYPERFAERAKANENFYKALLADTGLTRRPGEFLQIFEQAKSPAPTSIAIMDTELELFARLGDRGYALFLAAGSAEVHSVATGHGNGLNLKAELEATMPLPVLMDLLESWQKLYARIEK